MVSAKSTKLTNVIFLSILFLILDMINQRRKYRIEVDKEKDGKKRELIDRLEITSTFLEDILKNKLRENDQVLLQKFIESGELLGQTNKWISIEKLRDVDSSFKLGITKSDFLLHYSFRKLQEAFKIKILNKDDFKSVENIDMINQDVDVV